MLTAITEDAANTWGTVAAIGSTSVAIIALVVSLANRRSANEAEPVNS